MTLIPNIDYTLLQTATLSPLTLIGGIYYYDFGSYCVGSTATTTITLCNLTSNIQTYNWSALGGAPIYLNLSGITLNSYETYTFDIIFIPDSVRCFSPIW